MLRKFGFKKTEARDTDARQKLQKELFGFNKCMEHGFPNKVSAMGYDPQLGLLALGTKTGVLRVFGAAGVEFSAQHKDDVSVFHCVLFGQGQLVTLCSDNCLHLWEIGVKDGVSYLQEVRALPLENKVKTVSAHCLTLPGDQLLLGTESGHIFVVDLKTFKLQEKVVYQETIIQSAPDDFKVNPGAVESIVQHPVKQDQFLIGYNRGLIVLWDYKAGKAVHLYNASQQLESLTFIRSGEEFLSSHGNGSYITWTTSSPNKPKEQATTPYGPFPCKAINKIQWKTTKSKESMYVFSGGMPRASYGDRHTVTVIQGKDQHVVFDFTSKVIDFSLICSADELLAGSSPGRRAYDNPHTLIVLAEEELVLIDMLTSGWPMYRAPYLPSLHCSAITCTAHVGNVSRAFYNKLQDAGLQQLNNYSTRDWPIQGGINLLPQCTSLDILITGHEDGSVRFWDVSSTSITLLYKLLTAPMFACSSSQADSSDLDLDNDEEWPPFRKVGTYDPFSDDPRLAIQKIVLCPSSDMMVVGGTAGQVIVLQFERETRRHEARQIALNIIGDRDNFVWKGHDALPPRSKEVKYPAGFHPVAVIQIYPPAACTALTFNSDWQLVAVGTAHGFGVVDYIQRTLLVTRCTLNPTDLTGIGESTMARRKSFKKSLRESFRRLRSRRSDRRGRRPGTTTPGSRDSPGANRMSPVNSPRKGGGGGQTPTRGGSGSASHHHHVGGRGESADTSEDLDMSLGRPVERAVEARSADDVSASIVRTLYFADPFLVMGQQHTPTLWAGTNAGSVFVYQITVPSSSKRETDSVQCLLAKEIHLRHHAPVISVCVIDRNQFPLPSSLDVQHERSRHPDMSGGHSVIICSEEQLKIFSLPSLSGRDKLKLTAHEGTKIRKVGYVNFSSRADGSYVESDLVCLTNQGEVQVYSVPHLRRQLRAECIKKDNIIGIVSSVLSETGEGFYLSSPSELVRFSVSAHVITRPLCVVRPPPTDNIRADSRRLNDSLNKLTPTLSLRNRSPSHSEDQSSSPAVNHNVLSSSRQTVTAKVQRTVTESRTVTHTNHRTQGSTDD